MADEQPPSDSPALIAASASYSGPLPPSTEIAGYERTYAGAAKIIFDMAQEHARHRREMELKAIEIQREQQAQNRLALEANISIARHNQWIACGLSVLGFAFAFTLVSVGFTAWGIGMVLSELAVILGIFFYRESKNPP